eukprot:765264-Hanusia_phi.AAC.2
MIPSAGASGEGEVLPIVEENLVPVEEPDEVPYDKEKYKELFAKAQKEYPNVDWLFLHVAVVSELMGKEI